MTSVLPLLPEAYLLLTALGLVLAESAHHEEKVRLVLPTSLLGIAGALLQTLLAYQGQPAQIFAGTLSFDGFSLFFKTLFLLLAAVGVSSACLGDEIPKESRSEFCALVLLGTVGLTIAAGAANLFVAIAALQLAGVSGYFLAGLHRSGAPAVESSVKALFASLVSGVFMLVAAIALFLLVGTANLYELRQALSSAAVPGGTLLLLFSVLFLGLSLPMMVFPSQLWVPDVLQGGNSPAGTLVVLGLRAGAFALAIRILIVVFTVTGAAPGTWVPLGGWDWTAWLAFSAGMSLLLPALLAIRQASARRLVACIALVQGGFMLLGLLVLEEIGLAAILFNLLVDVLAFGGLMFLLGLSIQRTGSDQIARLRGCMQGRTGEGVGLVLFMIGWLGLPPFAGSVGRFALLGAAVRREWYLLAFFGVVAYGLTVVAAGRLLLSALDLDEGSSQRPDPARSSTAEPASHRRAVVLALLVPLVAATVFAERLLHWAGHSLRLIFW